MVNSHDSIRRGMVGRRRTRGRRRVVGRRRGRMVVYSIEI